MPNNFVTNGALVLEAFAIELYNELTLAPNVYRKLEDKFEMERPAGEAKFGTQLTMKKPKRFRAADGASFVAQDISEQTFNVNVDTWKHVGLELSVFDGTFKTAEDLMDKAGGILKPSIMTLADQIDLALAARATSLYQVTGTPGVTPGDTSVAAMTTAQTQRDFVKGTALLSQQGVSEKTIKKGFYEPFASGYVPVALSNLFVREAQEAVTSAKLGHLLDVDLFKNTNLPYHVAGTAISAGTLNASVAGQYDTGLTVNGANQTGTVISVTGGVNGRTLLAGDVIQFGSTAQVATYGAGINPVNVVNGSVFANVQKTFTVQQNVTLTGGAVNVVIDPPILSSGAYQTCSVTPANAAHVLGYTSHQANMIITPETLALVCVPLKKLNGAVYCERFNYKELSLLLTIGADVKEMQDFARIDVIFGTAAMYPETGVRHMG